MTRSALRSTSRPLPPGPPNRFPLGVGPEFGRDQLGTMLEASRRYGPVARLAFGPFGSVLVLGHPEGAQRVLQDNSANYLKSPFFADFVRLSFGDSLVTSEGERWLRDRRLMQPAFHRDRLRGFGETMVGATERMLKRWAGPASRGEPLELGAEFAQLTLEIVGRTLFSVDLSDQATALGAAYGKLTAYYAYRSSRAFPPPLWLPTPQNRAFLAARRSLAENVAALVRDRRAGRRGSVPEEAADLLAMLMAARYEGTDQGLSDEQLRSEAGAMIFAGHETSSAALAWTMHLLSTHPDPLERLGEELEAVLGGRLPTADDLPRLAYTRMVLEESLRLYPPAWGVARRARAEDELMGYAVPGGTNLAVFIYGLHRHPEFWPEPERFDPERFAPEAARDRPRFAHLPFGAGPRQCIGLQFAMMEMTLVLATVLGRYRPRPVPGHRVEPVTRFTLQPRFGLPMRLERV